MNREVPHGTECLRERSEVELQQPPRPRCTHPRAPTKSEFWQNKSGREKKGLHGRSLASDDLRLSAEAARRDSAASSQPPPTVTTSVNKRILQYIEVSGVGPRRQEEETVFWPSCSASGTQPPRRKVSVPPASGNCFYGGLEVAAKRPRRGRFVGSIPFSCCPRPSSEE
jgi:hypothetical protein